jgi:deoxycytidylate deaminase
MEPGSSIYPLNWKEFSTFSDNLADKFPVVKVNKNPVQYKKDNLNFLSNKDERFLQMAMGVALGSKCRFRHGCLVIKHGRVLAFSPNVQRNDPKNVNFQDCSFHAEERALKRAHYPKRAIIYVARVNSIGKRRFSRPCQRCMKLISSLKCRVVYTENED